MGDGCQCMGVNVVKGINVVILLVEGKSSGYGQVLLPEV